MKMTQDEKDRACSALQTTGYAYFAVATVADIMQVVTDIGLDPHEVEIVHSLAIGVIDDR
jgi:hypothetical protein